MKHLSKKSTAQSYQNRILLELSRVENYNKWTIDKFLDFTGGKYLEVGAGTGNIASLVREQGIDITPSEKDRGFLKTLKANFKKAFLLDIESPKDSLRGFYFDTVIAINVLEHIKNDALALKNINRVLNPQGKLILLVPAHQMLFGSYDKGLRHYRRYSKNELELKLKQAGFKVLKSKYLNKVGALAWFLNAVILKRTAFPKYQLYIIDKLVPALDFFDKLIFFPFGLSIICICQKVNGQNNMKPKDQAQD